MAQKKPFTSAEQMPDGSGQSFYSIIVSKPHICFFLLSVFLLGCESFEKRSTFFPDQMDVYKQRQEDIQANVPPGGERPLVPYPLEFLRDAVVQVLESSANAREAADKINLPLTRDDWRLLGRWVCFDIEDRKNKDLRVFICQDRFLGWIDWYGLFQRSEDEVYLKIRLNKDGKPDRSRPDWYMGVYCSRAAISGFTTEVKYCVDD